MEVEGMCESVLQSLPFYEKVYSLSLDKSRMDAYYYNKYSILSINIIVFPELLELLKSGIF
jgi:hypothetical protein